MPNGMYGGVRGARDYPLLDVINMLLCIDVDSYSSSSVGNGMPVLFSR